VCAVDNQWYLPQQHYVAHPMPHYGISSTARQHCCSQMAIRHNGVWLMPTAEADGNVPFALPATCSKLRLSFPHKVDSERGTAKWDNKKKTLTVTLPIIRDDPFA
jgi:hypothetical protein